MKTGTNILLLKLNSYWSDISFIIVQVHVHKYIPEEQALSDELSPGSHWCRPLQDQSIVDKQLYIAPSAFPTTVQEIRLLCKL